MGKSGQKRLDQLIDQVARGERQLSSISDPKLREAVRAALRLHDDAPAAPDAYARARMRARVMAGLEPRRPTLLDNAWTALELLARPAPYIVRGIAFASVAVCLGMGAIVASADTLPDDLLYPVKLTTEQIRLALAEAPGDRASVELSIAAHRLSEAERLAGSGRTSDALVASALYSQHIASAAAELAPQDDETDLGAQLETAFTAQRKRAQALAVTLAADVKSARGAQILAMIASPTYAPGQTKIEQVAITAASVAQQLSVAADQAAADEAAAPNTPVTASQSSPVTAAPTTAARGTTRPAETVGSTPTTTVTPTVSAAQSTAAAPASGAPSASATASAPASAATATSASPSASSSSSTAPSASVGPSAPSTASAPSTPAARESQRTTTTNTNTTNTSNTTTNTSNTTTNSPNTGTRGAQDTANRVKDAADKAKAAADKLQETLKQKDSNKPKGR